MITVKKLIDSHIFNCTYITEINIQYYGLVVIYGEEVALGRGWAKIKAGQKEEHKNPAGWKKLKKNSKYEHF